MNATQADLNYARTLLNSGDLSAMYTHLESLGSSYATLAKGVAEGGTLSGEAALSYMESVAAEGGRTLTESDVDAIRQDMARGYLDTLQEQIDRTGSISREINADEAQAFHDSVFAQNGLSPNAWTLTTPFKSYGDNKQEYWERVLSTAGDSSAELLMSLEQLQRMALGGWWLGGDFGQEMTDWSDRMFLALNPSVLQEFGESVLDLINSGLEYVGDWWGSYFFHLINPDANSLFSSSRSWARSRYYDPLALDLDGVGIETTGISNWQGTTLFDHDGDGVADGTGWLSGEDGWLVRDLNANGTIDTGAELFGNNTTLSNGTTSGNPPWSANPSHPQ